VLTTLLGSDGVLADELSAAGENAAEVLGPWLVGEGVDEDVPDLARQQFLGFRRKAHEGIEFPIREEPHRVTHGRVGPDDVLAGIETDIRHDARDEGVASDAGDGHRLALEVADGTNPLRGQELVAARVKPGEQDGGAAGVKAQDVRRRIVRAEVDLTGVQGHGDEAMARADGEPSHWYGNVLHAAESLGEEQWLRHEHGS
jgi:hypothetical protein